MTIIIDLVEPHLPQEIIKVLILLPWTLLQAIQCFP